MSAYYNEIDKFAAQWLRELIKAGLIADGEVDERDIRDVRAEDVRGFTQCHWFAGIGGWSYALRLAGWPDDRPVWTGSCPCQPFSAAGTQSGTDDPRHLWPAWVPLIRECRPHAIFGEQVESAINHGWFDLVSDDLEREGYAVGAAGLPACSVGAFHIRQRLWFVADTDGRHAEHGELQLRGQLGLRAEDRRDVRPSQDNQWPEGTLAESNNPRTRRTAAAEPSRNGAHDGIPRENCRIGRVGHGIGAGLERFAGDGDDGHEPGRLDAGAARPVAKAGGVDWRAVEWNPCRDGKARPTQPGIFPLAHGVSNRVGTLRGAGNAIVPQVAQAFIEAYLERND